MSRSVIDEAGNRHGRLTVLNQAESKNGRTMWSCRCDCGKEVEVRGNHLRKGKIRSCGCLRDEITHKRCFIDKTGHQYGRLTVLSHAGTNRWGQHLWLCHCECGKKTTVLGASLQRGATRSCGCLCKERVSETRRLPTGEAAFNRLVDRMKRSTIRRGHTWALLDSQVKRLTSQACYYCGAEPAQVSSGADLNGTYTYNGLDRINNEKGYLPENVVSCCSTCNYAKRAMTQSEFLTWVSRVYKHSMDEEK